MIFFWQGTARYILECCYKLIIADPVSYGFRHSKDDLYPELNL